MARAVGVVRLGRRAFGPERLLVMAVVSPGDPAAAMERVHEAVAEGADIVDIGGGRTVPFIAAVRDAYPELVIGVRWVRPEMAREACAAGADLINDSWGGWDDKLAGVAAEFGAGLVCAHTGGQRPRTRPFRVWYADLMADVLDQTLGLASRAEQAGVDPARIIIDAAHDFGKNTWHSLEITRRLSEMTATGWPVLVSLSNKDFVGETLNAAVDERLAGTLAATAVCAWQGARIFRAHNVVQTRHVVDMVAAIKGDVPPARAVRGLA